MVLGKRRLSVGIPYIGLTISSVKISAQERIKDGIGV